MEATKDSSKEESVVKKRFIGDLIHDSFYDQLVLIGFPYDQGARNCQFRQGSFLGPDCFRRFIKNASFGVLKNVEVNMDIEKTLGPISDYGNIQIDKVTDNSKNISDENIQMLYDKLSLKHKLCLQRNNISFVVGGTKDMVFPLFKSFQEISKDEKLLTLSKDICSYFIIFSNQVT